MKSNIIIPETIKVGFQDRDDTYTKKLAYVIYYDHKGVLRKEASWNSWRDKDIPDLSLSNIPTSGFVLNKKAGGYSSGWNHRQTYVRVYDPRDFEFEISVPNLLYILENTNSIKGKGLEGEFVYGWDGTDIVLIPTSSPDFTEITQFNDILKEKKHIKGKELLLGAAYKSKDNRKLIYLGRYDYYGWKGEKEGKKYFFYNEDRYSYLETMKTLGDKIISVVSEECVENYAELMDKLESDSHYSPYDQSKDEFVDCDYELFKSKVTNDRWGTKFHSGHGVIKVSENYPDPSFYKVSIEVPTSWSYTRDEVIYKGSLEDIYETYKPKYKNKYLANGKLYQKDTI